MTALLDQLNMENIIFLVAAIGIFAISGTTHQPSLVKVEGGLVQGISEDSLTVFKGVPIAAPSVGELRWRPPQPVEKWEGVKQVTKFASAPLMEFT
jgi:para-nitrobenzyl esterase